MRFVLIDRITEINPGQSLTAVKNLSLAEEYLADHFPGFPVMPAPLILEGLAQTGGILVGEARQYRENVVLAKMSNAKFHRDALAGEQLTYTTTLLDINDTGARVAATAHSGPDLVAEVEILFAHANPAQLPPGLPDTKFVFSGEMTQLLRLAAAVSKPGV